MKKQIILVTLCLIAILVSISAISAANVYINTTGDDDTGDGTISNPFKSILKGVNNATDGDTVIIADGTYKGENNTYIDITKNMTIAGQSQANTIIDGEGLNWIFSVDTPGLNVTFSKLTLKNAYINWDDGAAIWSEGSTVTVSQCTFINNTAYGYDGGAIYNGYGNLTVNDCTFTSNNARYGGAIFTYGTCTVNNCIFTDNKAGGGGAIFNDDTLTVTGSTFTGNKANFDGGAISTHHNTATITGSTFTGNEAYYGGAIRACCGKPTIIENIFKNNIASYGGAIYNSASLILKYNTIENNKALLNLQALNTVNAQAETVGEGGGIFLMSYSSYEIIGNHILNNIGSGIHIGLPYELGSTGALSVIEEEIKAIINFNRIYGNTPYGIYNETITATADVSAADMPLPTLNAKYNWWGSNAGPNSAGADKTNLESIYYAPWIVMKLTPTKVVINGGETTLLTASFLYDNNGTYHDPANGHIPDGTPVTFTTSLGQVGSQTITTYTVNGIATAILRAVDSAGNPISGIAYITATTDAQTLSTSVSIIEIPEANAATNTTNTTSTVGMQETGIPLAGLLLAILALFGGFAISKK